MTFYQIPILMIYPLCTTCYDAQQQLGRLLGALAKRAALELSGGKRPAAAQGELERQAGQLEGIEVEALGWDQVHVDEALDAAPQTQGVVDEGAGRRCRGRPRRPAPAPAVVATSHPAA